MNVTQQRSAWVRASGLIRRLMAAVGRVLAECQRAQRDMALLRMQPDLYTCHGDCPPETYAEFLFRCPGALWHEPSARERAEGTRRKP